MHSNVTRELRNNSPITKSEITKPPCIIAIIIIFPPIYLAPGFLEVEQHQLVH